MTEGITSPGTGPLNESNEKNKPTSSPLDEKIFRAIKPILEGFGLALVTGLIEKTFYSAKKTPPETRSPAPEAEKADEHESALQKNENSKFTGLFNKIYEKPEKTENSPLNKILSDIPFYHGEVSPKQLLQERTPGTTFICKSFKDDPATSKTPRFKDDEILIVYADAAGKAKLVQLNYVDGQFVYLKNNISTKEEFTEPSFSEGRPYPHDYRFEEVKYPTVHAFINAHPTLKNPLFKEDLSKLSLYFKNIQAKDAEEILNGKPSGTYLIRDSHRHPGSYVLTYVDKENAVAHIDLIKTPAGYRVGEKFYHSLKDFVKAHPELRYRQ